MSLATSPVRHPCPVDTPSDAGRLDAAGARAAFRASSADPAVDAAAWPVVTYRPRLQPWLGWVEFPVLLVVGLAFIHALVGPAGLIIFGPLAVPFALLGPVTSRSQVRIDDDGLCVKVNIRSRDVAWEDVRWVEGAGPRRGGGPVARGRVGLVDGDVVWLPGYPRRTPVDLRRSQRPAAAVADGWGARLVRGGAARR